MKRIFILTALVTFISILSWCETYKILFINTPTITIGKKNLKVGDTFDDKEVIKWSSDKQAIKVQNTRNHKLRIITASQAKESKTLKDFFVKTNHMSTRGEPIPLDTLRKELLNKFYLLDDISFSQCNSFNVNDTHYYVMEHQNGDEAKQCKLTVDEEDKIVLITRDLFDSVNTDDDITVTIKFIDPENGTTTITDQMVISIIPLEL